ncbi:hypothetical protein J2X14_001700 [Pantoea alhagi]|uniref:hypothetical protein n=1 Tax=Mixta sp. BE291 TaxID=3158787 RepID=UPI0028544587|nr:hypothetical protein [Pantoea alhagi]
MFISATPGQKDKITLKNSPFHGRKTDCLRNELQKRMPMQEKVDQMVKFGLNSALKND